MNREQELKKLIAEQARDDRPFQAPETHTVPYGLVLEVMDERGRIRDMPRLRQPECMLHGNSETMVDLSRGDGLRCRACERERKRKSRALHPDPEHTANRQRERDRYRNDPEYREAKRAYQRAYRARARGGEAATG